MKAASLFFVFILAKAVILAGHTVRLSLWMPLAYLWQDALVALLFGLLEWKLPARIGTVLYWSLAAYVALNIPVGRAVATPLTWPMIRAARGPLADSLSIYITPLNLALIALVLIAAAIIPRLRFIKAALPVAFGCVALGPLAIRHVDTSGMDRNPISALVLGAMPHIGSASANADWRASAFSPPPGTDLSRFRGIAKGRNVILVSLESTAAQYLKLYGAESDPTPNLTTLAQNAIVFDSANAAYPESILGLYSVLCSTFPAFDTKPEAYADLPCRSLPKTLADSGYRTALFHSGRFGYLGMESVIRNRGFQTLEDAGDIGGNHESSFGVDEPSTVSRMLSWIDTQPQDQPFFLAYLPIAGHHPYETPEPGPFSSSDSLGRYRNALHYGDASLGTLIEGIRSRGLEEKTLWILYGDHGEAFGQHDGNSGHTFFLYEENVHVPFLVAAPGAIRGQTRSTNTMSLVDTAPTTLDLLGFPKNARYQGTSMLAAGSRMSLFYTDYSLGLLGLRDGQYKYIYDLDSRRSKLFDLDSDPAEKLDISTQDRQRSTWYKQRLKAWSAAQKAYIAERHATSNP